MLAHLPSDVIRMREISAGVPMKAPLAPAVTPEITIEDVTHESDV